MSGPRMLAAFLLALTMSCERLSELFPGGQSPDASVEPVPWNISWGEYAATLDVPACPDDSVLVVNALDDSFDAGRAFDSLPDVGQRLTFREAMYFAASLPGPQTVLFDEGVFPAEAPGTIVLGNLAMPGNPGPVCIDGRHRGVVFDFGAENDCCYSGAGCCMVRVGSGSTLVGLTFLNLPYEIEPARTQIAGCRIGTDGRAVFLNSFGRPWQLDLMTEARLGPGNVIAAGIFGLRHITSAATVDHNFFGVDVLTRNLVGIGTGIDLGSIGRLDANIIEDNVFATPEGALRAGAGNAIIRNNLVGIDRDGFRFPHREMGLGRFTTWGGFESQYVVGPGNVVRGSNVAIMVDPDATVTVTRNSLSENGVPLAYSGASPVEPPELLSVSATEASGTCSTPGVVELFSGSGSGPETFLTEAKCTTGSFAAVMPSVPDPSGREITASLTDAQGRTSAFSNALRVP